MSSKRQNDDDLHRKDEGRDEERVRLYQVCALTSLYIFAKEKPQFASCYERITKNPRQTGTLRGRLRAGVCVGSQAS